MSLRTRRLWILPVLALAAAAAGPGAARAGDETPAVTQASDLDELARRSTDPTASPMNFAFLNAVTASHYDLPDGTPVGETGYELKFQPVLPFKAWGVDNILRMTLPYQVTGPGPSGLEDVTIFDLLVFGQSWGRLGVGAVGSFSARSNDASSHAAGGPAIGAVVPLSKKLNIGLFSQNLFSGDVAISQLQPIAAYQMGDGWSLSLGDLQYVYDWKRGGWVSLPIGFQIGKVLPVGKQPMRFAVNPQYNFKNLPGAPRFSVTVTVAVIIPGK